MKRSPQHSATGLLHAVTFVYFHTFQKKPRTMKNGLLLIAAIMLITAASCKKDKKTGKTEALIFNETHCSDPWVRDVPGNSTNFTQKLQAWLIAKTGVPIGEPKREFNKEKGNYCLACSCLSGNVSIIRVTKGTEQKFIDLGFKKVE